MGVMSVARISVFSFFCIMAFFVAISAGSLSAEPARQFVLTPEERGYLESLRARPVVIAYSDDIVGAEFEGRSYGMLEPLFDVLRDTFGLELHLVERSWNEVFRQLESGTVDFYGPIAITEERRQRYMVVEPFFRSHAKVVTRVARPVQSLRGLYGARVGMRESAAALVARAVGAYLGPYGQIVSFPTEDDMIMALSSGSIDAFFLVGNVEFEIFRHEDIQIELILDYFFVEQGLISGNEDMRPLAALLNRYLRENPQIPGQIVNMRTQALLQFMRERFADEIAFIQKNYDTIAMYAPPNLYPLTYMEHGRMRGMQLEINNLFTKLTGVGVRFVPLDDFPNGIVDALENLRTGEIQVFAGALHDIGTRDHPATEYSPLLWPDILRFYSKDAIDDLTGKTIGAAHLSGDYLGWTATSGTPVIFYGGYDALLHALDKGEVDVIFMGETGFFYRYAVRNDFSLREIAGPSAEATRHLLYGTQNMEVNALFNVALALFPVIDPQAIGRWQSYTHRHKAELLRLRHTQQIWLMTALAVFSVMLVGLAYLLRRTWRLHVETKKKNVALAEAHDIISASINYASKIQKNILPRHDVFKAAFSDYSVIWKPRDIVGGDIYWAKNFDDGTVLCVCDCTGHGTPGALLTMIVMSMFETLVTDENYRDTAQILYMLDKKLVAALHANEDGEGKRGIQDINDGCDLAVLFVAKDGSVAMSAGNMHVFICDGKKVTQYRGQRVSAGEGNLKNKNDVIVHNIPANPDNKFYIASDGLFTQVGGKSNKQYGYDVFKQIILENHLENQAVISDKVWSSFEEYRGEQPRRDDFELVSFKP